jgi:hypothetical protein
VILCYQIPHFHFNISFQNFFIKTEVLEAGKINKGDAVKMMIYGFNRQKDESKADIKIYRET